MVVISENAGKAELGLKVTGPSSQDHVPFNVSTTERGHHVTYVAMETGTYVIDVTYGRLTVPGRLAVTVLTCRTIRY